jgi:hypothetical protein
VQTLGGISLAEALTDNFTIAVLKSVSEAVGVPTSAVSGTIGAGNVNLRRLLADINMVYDLGIITNLNTSETISKIESSVDSGAFLTSLRTHSGINITALASGVVTDPPLKTVPSAEPTPFIKAAVQKSKNIHVLLSYYRHIQLNLNCKPHLNFFSYSNYDYPFCAIIIYRGHKESWCYHWRHHSFLLCHGNSPSHCCVLFL